MKRLVLSLLVLLAATGSSFAQAGDYKITKIAPAVIRTPIYQFQGDQRRTSQSEQWLEVEVEFNAKQPEWTDELTLKYYILLADGATQKLLIGEVTHINVPSTKANPRATSLYSVMYVPPRNLQKLLSLGGRSLTTSAIVNIGIEVLKQGQLVAQESWKPARGPWWQTMQQISGQVLNKNETPFAPLYWDRYEAIKAQTR
jgi:hypothetical protein